MTLKQVKKGFLAKMQEAFPKEQYHYYSMIVTEGYERPAFFTQIQPVSAGPVNYNSYRTSAIFAITYFQDVIDEAEILDVIQRVRDIFGLCVKIGNRSISITGFDWDYSGTEGNVAEILVSVSWFDRVNHAKEYPLMQNMTLNSELEEWKNGNA